MSEFSINPDKSCGPKTAPKKLKPSVKKPKSLDFDEPEPQPHTASSEEAGGSGYVVAGVVSTLIVLGNRAVIGCSHAKPQNVNIKKCTTICFFISQGYVLCKILWWGRGNGCWGK